MMTTTFAVPGTRDVLKVTGTDAVSFLQGQMSADIARLAAGEQCWSLLLQPQGKFEAWVRVHRTDDAVLLDVDAGSGASVATRLNRFRIRVDVELTELDWDSLTLVGPDAAALGQACLSDGGVVAQRRRPGRVAVSNADADSPMGSADADSVLVAVDVLGPAGTLNRPEGASPGTSDQLAAALVPAGWPSAGAEIDSSVIPAELGQWLVDCSVSFTKGCYVGQELVARIDSRGAATPRRMRLLVGSPGGDPFVVGDAVLASGTERGRVSSAAVVGGVPLGLSLLHRSVESSTPVQVGDLADRSVEALVTDPPFANG